MGVLDVLGSLAVAGIDTALKNDNFVTGVALSENGDRKLSNLMDTRQDISRTLDGRRLARSNTSTVTGKQAAIGLGFLAIVGIGAALLSGSTKDSEKENNTSSKKSATINYGSRNLP